MIVDETEPLNARDELTRACPGCGLVLPARDSPTHAYLGSSPECWALYAELLAREFGEPDYFSVHQLTVDTYAVQHPGRPERRTIQSLGLHLTTLCLVLEQAFDARKGPTVHKRLAGKPWFEWLNPPASRGRTTVADVLRAAAEHQQLVRAWASVVWAAWEPHHATVREWARRALDDSDGA